MLILYSKKKYCDNREKLNERNRELYSKQVGNIKEDSE